MSRRAASYSVIDNLELARRAEEERRRLEADRRERERRAALARAQEAARVLQDRLERLQRRIEGERRAYPAAAFEDVPDHLLDEQRHDDVAEAQAWADQLEAAVAEATSRFETTLANTRGASIAAALQAGDEQARGAGDLIEQARVDAEAAASAARRDAEATAQLDAERQMSADRETAVALADRLDADAGAAEIADIGRRVAEIEETPNATRRAALVNDLRTVVHDIGETFEHRRRERAEAVALRDALAGLDGPDVSGAALALDRVVSLEADLTDELRDAARSAAAAARHRADEHYAASVVVDILEGKGYEVSDGFTSMFDSDQGGGGYFQQASWGPYAVRCLRAPDGSLSFTTVRVDEPTRPASADVARRDREMDETGCHVVEDLLDEMTRRGVGVQVHRDEPPGAALLVVPPDRVPLHVAAPRSARSARPEAEASGAGGES